MIFKEGEKVIAVSNFDSYIKEGEIYLVVKIWRCGCGQNISPGSQYLTGAVVSCPDCSGLNYDGFKYAPAACFMKESDWNKIETQVNDLLNA
jgi:hypothetical protein